MVKEKKKKLTIDEKLDVIAKSVGGLRRDVDVLKHKKETLETMNKVNGIMKRVNNNFILWGNLKSLDGVTKEQQQQFFNEVRDLMIKHKIVYVVANLVKNF